MKLQRRKINNYIALGTLALGTLLGTFVLSNSTNQNIKNIEDAQTINTREQNQEELERHSDGSFSFRGEVSVMTGEEVAVWKDFHNNYHEKYNLLVQHPIIEVQTRTKLQIRVPLEIHSMNQVHPLLAKDSTPTFYYKGLGTEMKYVQDNQYYYHGTTEPYKFTNSDGYIHESPKGEPVDVVMTAQTFDGTSLYGPMDSLDDAAIRFQRGGNAYTDPCSMTLNLSEDDFVDETGLAPEVKSFKATNTDENEVLFTWEIDTKEMILKEVNIYKDADRLTGQEIPLEAKGSVVYKTDNKDTHKYSLQAITTKGSDAESIVVEGFDLKPAETPGLRKFYYDPRFEGMIYASVDYMNNRPGYEDIWYGEGKLIDADTGLVAAKTTTYSIDGDVITYRFSKTSYLNLQSDYYFVFTDNKTGKSYTTKQGLDGVLISMELNGNNEIVSFKD